MKDWKNEELQDALEEVFRRAVVDPAFRALALQDGRGAIAAVSLKPLPDGVVVNFVDNSGPVKTIPLPDLIDGIVEELTEDDLEEVAGGGGPPTNPPIVGG